MPRSAPREWLLATSLIASGGAMVYIVREYGLDVIELPFLPVPVQIAWLITATWAMYFGGGALIGAGAFLPFKKARWGALLGLVIQFAVLVVTWLSSSPE